ncbi:NEW3 domain-containing protein [Lysobacter tyrosinilyticus]
MPCSRPVLIQPGRSKASPFLSLQLPLLLAMAMPALQPAHADTFYVRVDGGDAVECNGHSDAPYPGTGIGQNCAWKHPFFAMAPDGTRRINGGDTLRIGSGSYMMGQGAPGAGSCLPGNCYMSPVPSGTGSATTRILGNASQPPQLWGTLGTARILNLDGSSNVEIGYLDITDHDDCVYSHSNASVKCPAVGIGTWGKYGVYARASQNVWLHDVDIHGLGHSGLWAGGLTDWTMERVKINRNGRAGWDANIGTGASNSGAITLRNMEFGWNGCGERWQTEQAWACWGQQSGGYGDGFGTVATGGQWLIEDVFAHHNTQDGLDLRFLDGAASTHATLRRVYAMGNAGNQIKVKGNSLVENSVLIGNCGFFSGQYYMQAADQCRADGTTLLLVFTANDDVVVRHNTITGQGWSLIGATEGDSSGHALIQNNALVGYPWFLNPADLSRVQAGTSPAVITHVGNLVWNVYGNTCPGDSICGQYPQLKSMTLATFDAELLAGSPLADRVAPLADVTTDFMLTSRPQGSASDVGAYEMPVINACTHAAPTLNLSGSTSAVPAGSTVTYTLTLTNNDGTACGATSFSLAKSVPSGWSGNLADASLSLAPGASDTTTLSVTSASDAAANGYNIGAGASSSIGAIHTASDAITYTVSAPVPVCTRAAPTINLSGSTAAVGAGSTITYTLALTNNDSEACAASDFSLAASVPADWTGAFAETSLNLAPGASGNTALDVTSASNATANTYNIGAGASSNIGVVHTANDTIAYTVSPPPVCSRATPTVNLSGSTGAVPAGSGITYTLAVTNNDSAACTATTFSLADSVPSNWNGTLDDTSLTLAPGASGSTTLSVTSASDADPGGYNIGAGISSGVGAVHTATDTIAFTVADPAPVCTRAAPTISLTGSTTAVPAGSSITYTLALTNNDSEACTTTSFNLADSVPAGWSDSLADTSLNLAPGASGSTTLTVTSATNAAANGYTISASAGSSVGSVHAANTTITYTVSPPPPVCTRATPTISLTGSTTAVPAGSSISYTLALTNNDSVECAATSFSLANSVPGGWTGTLGASSLNLAPGASNSTTLNVTSAGNAAANPYTIGASASSNVGAVHAANTTITYTISPPAPVCTRAAPTISLTGSTTAVPAGSSISYTLALTNNDSVECATTSFNLADSVPAGWAGTLGVTSFSLAPGASNSTTLNVTSAASAAANPYTIGASASSSVGAVHAANTTIIYTVSAPPPVCTRAAPTISLTGSTTAVPAGSSISYTLSLTNNDSVECAATSFNLADSVPAGWTGTLGVTSFSVAPGASSSTTLNVTSAASAAANPYAIGASASSNVGAVHAASTTITYTVSPPPPVCTRAAPTIGLTGSTTAVPAGSTVTYSLALTNNDSTACAATSFGLARSVPSGWTGTLGASSLSLVPGASGSTTLTVTSAGNAAANPYTIGASASSSVGAVHAASTTITYTVSPPPPVCTRVAPTISLTGSTTAVPAGSTVTYSLALTNNDSTACAATSFGLARSVPSGWTGTLGVSSLNLAPGASGNTSLAVTSSSNASAGGYSIGASASSNVGAVHNASTAITYTVAAPAISLQTNVSTDKTTYPRGDLVRIQALVRNNGTPVAGAVVTFTIIRPAGGNIVQTATSGSDGIARTTYRLNKAKTAAGQYRVQATWSLSGVSSSGSVTFVSL